MASHYQRSADVLPFGPPVDYPTHRRPTSAEQIARVTRDKEMLQALRDKVIRKAELDREFDKDLRIIGYGLAFAYAWVCIFRIAQIVGMLP